MSDIWKKRIDAHLVQKEQEREHQEEVAKAEKAARKREAEERRRKEREGEVEKLGKAFQCAVCGTPATKPFQELHTSGKSLSPGTDETYQLKPWFEDDWTRPGDLKKCRQCSGWVCENDLYQGICRNCAEKL